MPKRKSIEFHISYKKIPCGILKVYSLNSPPAEMVPALYLNKTRIRNSFIYPYFTVLFLYYLKSSIGKLVFLYLVRTPVPHGRDGHADDHSGPRQVRGHRVSEYVEGVISRNATGRVWHTNRRDGSWVPVHQSIPASDLREASTGEEGRGGERGRGAQQGQSNWNIRVPVTE